MHLELSQARLCTLLRLAHLADTAESFVNEGPHTTALAMSGAWRGRADRTFFWFELTRPSDRTEGGTGIVAKTAPVPTARVANICPATDGSSQLTEGWGPVSFDDWTQKPIRACSSVG